MNLPARSSSTIHADGVSKSFGQRIAVDGVSLDVAHGEIFGLLGPNAAGKTTLIRILCGILAPDAGRLTIAGQPLAQAKRSFGYVAQHFGQYEDLSVKENLEFYASMYGIRDANRTEQLLRRYGLLRFENDPAGLLSGGYKRRLALACALAHDPGVLFLDEPTAGIDPVTRKLLWDEFYELAAEGKTLFVTTHYMEEAQRCHRLAFISSGKLIAQGTPASMRDSLGDAAVYASTVAYAPQLRSALRRMPGMMLVNQFGDELRMVVARGVDPDDLQATITAATGTTAPIHRAEPNLEDVFIALTQEPDQAT